MVMLSKQTSAKNVSDREARSLAELTALITGILCCDLMIYSIKALSFNLLDAWSLALGIAGLFYTIAFYYAIVKKPEQLQKWKWPTTIIDAVCVTAGLIVTPNEFRPIPLTIGILIAVSIVILWDRRTSYIFLLATVCLHVLFSILFSVNLSPYWINDFALVALGIIMLETLHRSNKTTRDRIQRLETLNQFARKIVFSLETDEVLTLVGAAIQQAIPADTYFVGVTDDLQTIKFDLLFDDGEYFPPSVTPMEGTLSGWVIRNRHSLFIPDMRKNVDPEGVNVVLIGKNRNNLSWMGVPMLAEHVTGVVSIGSYKPNSFDRTDFDLLENLAQQAALALDNAFHHAEVRAQSRTDSLTGAYNHNYIVNILRREAETTVQSLSLIMLDVDYFKKYNDLYGHMIGDQVLILLTKTIHEHIKDTDAVGRWGGEEFVVVLPNTNGRQAFAIAERIQKNMSTLLLRGRNGEYLPAPTVSQGIAVFPHDTDDIDHLIDLADQRLYLAKERGRNQVEPAGGPDDEHWSI